MGLNDINEVDVRKNDSPLQYVIGVVRHGCADVILGHVSDFMSIAH
jgi:hypothetical protein